MIYFIACNDTVKIGTAADVTSRLKALQTANPDPLCLLGTIPGGSDLERTLHQKFKDFRVRGEWFRNTGALAAFIAGSFEDFPCRLLRANDEFFGLLGSEPQYEKSFYRAYVHSEEQWWRFQWDVRASTYDPLERQAHIPEALQTKTVHAKLCELQGYTCDPTRAGLSKLFKHIEGFYA